MNVLSNLLNEGADLGHFGYHPRCESEKLTHLCFADDLLIFCDGSLASIKGVFQILADFEHMSGLKVNAAKTCFFSSGLSSLEISRIEEELHITQASLPVRYLGLPLCTKKLSLLDCEPLLQRIRGKLQSWTSRHLSFAGRLQLLSSVISGITNFWSSTFLLPKKCTEKIRSLCSAFLWKGDPSSTYGARISWETICKPKEEGGLGLKDVNEVNSVSLLKLVWMFFLRSGSIWVAWMHKRYLVGKNFWAIKYRYSLPWTFRKLLKLRDRAFSFIRIDLGNGKNTDFWQDNWSPFGSLIKQFGTSGPRQLGVPLNTTVAEIFVQGGWRINQPRSELHLQLATFLTTVTLLQDIDDKPQWTINDNTFTTFSFSSVWDSIRSRSPKVDWATLAWHFGTIPKCSFFCWMLLQNRLVTKDRLHSWGIIVDPKCILCNQGLESRAHLFFECTFSSQIWTCILRRLGVNSQTNTWEGSFSFIKSRSKVKDQGTLLLLAWQVTLYSLWRERNQRIHRQIFRSPDFLLRQIDQMIRNRLSSIRRAHPLRSSTMLQLWFSRNYYPP